MIYAAITLACHDDMQDRMIEEIDHVYADAAKHGIRELDYKSNWHRFSYTLAFMVSAPIIGRWLNFSYYHSIHNDPIANLIPGYHTPSRTQFNQTERSLH